MAKTFNKLICQQSGSICGAFLKRTLWYSVTDRTCFTILVALDSEVQRVGRATASDVLMMGKQKKLGCVIGSLMTLVKNVGCCY
ncbi:hypothetical protein C5167_032805 [Papaver somniferum]|uniref:Uncharacterized protein n=1 Tax=Papaver somniferum TaxID=3469 RepID=A0A4Y7K8K6_PAPSO|nr:hypothetical protein C5167_032805 [Papaver somniferum]